MGNDYIVSVYPATYIQCLLTCTPRAQLSSLQATTTNTYPTLLLSIMHDIPIQQTQLSFPPAPKTEAFISYSTVLSAVQNLQLSHPIDFLLPQIQNQDQYPFDRQLSISRSLCSFLAISLAMYSSISLLISPSP